MPRCRAEAEIFNKKVTSVTAVTAATGMMRHFRDKDLGAWLY